LLANTPVLVSAVGQVSSNRLAGRTSSPVLLEATGDFAKISLVKLVLGCFIFTFKKTTLICGFFKCKNKIELNFILRRWF
ncbi:MAG: hypothetical protein K2I36_02360, partial [Ureaplasma sp.]|nr:hypothetical protein [Ureaplasma sp.]